MSGLSQSQLGIYFACQNTDLSLANYQISFLYTLPDSIDLDRLRKALEAVLDAHPYLSSRIVTDEGLPEIVPGDRIDIKIIETEDINSHYPDFLRPMDLDKDALARFEIYKTASGNFFFLDIHHIIDDGSSMNVFFSDLEAAYDGIALEKEALDGSDIALLEQKLRDSDEWEVQKEWYLKEFGDAQDLNSMPNPSMTIPENAGMGYDSITVHLPVTCADIHKICAENDVKKSAVFITTWGKMLANFSASDKVFFTTIHNGRTVKGCERTMTMMVKTLPVYISFDPKESLKSLLQGLATQQDEARLKTAYSFSDLHQDLGVRDDIIFAYQGTLAPESKFPIKLGDDIITCQDLRTAIPGPGISAELFEVRGNSDGSDYILRIIFRTDLFTPELITSMAESYNATLNSMKEARTTGELEASSDSQKQWLDAQKPDCKDAKLLDKDLISIFRENAERNPDRLFCVFENRKFTYARVDKITDELASRIQARIGTDGGKVVSFISPRNELMAIIPISIVKAGCTYQPLDSSYPSERLNYMINDADASLLICNSEHRALVNGYEGDTLLIEDSAVADSDSKPVPVIPDTSKTLLLLYTSGTTGTPKGVMITQDNLLAMVSHHISYQGIDGTSAIASYASYGFDAFAMDLWGTAVSGACLHIISEEIRYDLVAIHDYFVSNGITHAFMTTQVGSQMAINFPDIPGMKALFVGGEKLVSLDPPSYKLINGYGPTESIAYVTCYTVSGNERNIPIGRPTLTTRVYVVNKDGKRLPMGAAGELWVSGRQVSKGYLKLPEKTAESFIPNPFVSEDQKADFPTIYRTGDIVRYREDGEIEFVGRKDGQVKIRGFRIELKEVEAVIRDFEGITDVTVQAFDLEEGGKAIAAYVVSDSQVDIQALNNFILQQKPPYMVPAVTIQIESIPLNVNGKVDKKKLPEPRKEVSDGNGSSIGTEAAPLNRLEKELMEMVSQLADCSEFPITTPLTYVGLSSISSLKLSTKLFKQYGVNISNKELTHGATIQSIENAILDSLLDKTDKSAESSAVPSGQMVKEAALTFSQTGVFLECLKNPDSTVYNIPSLVRFPDSVSSEKLKTAVEEVLAAHPVFFTHFESNSDPVKLVLNPDQKPSVAIIGQDIDELKKEFVKPFNLTEGPLYRAVISGSNLLFDAHHLIFDGSSMSLILHQICDRLEGKTITAEACSYLEYADKEGKSDLSDAEKYFTEQLSSIEEASSIPSDLHFDEKEGKSAEVVRIVDHGKVESFARKCGITTASVYLAAIEYLAARYCNSKEACICTVSSGRGRQEIADTVGMFVNTLALGAHIGSGTIEEFVVKAADNFEESINHENYPFARISEKFGLNPDLMFVYQLGVVDKFSVDGATVSLEELKLSAPKFKMAILVEEKDGDTCLVAQYNDALYSKEMVGRLLDSLEATISNIILEPDSPITRLSIISEKQKGELEPIRCGVKVPVPLKILHKGIERWTDKTPDRPAVIATDRTLSYLELDKEANRIANALIAKGMKKGQPVVALLPRDSRTISCILGIIKAGGAFIPCDPEYPTERIKLISEDSGAAFVVTTAALAPNYGSRGLDIACLIDWNDDKDPGIEVSPDDLVYMVYTSGSTGRPKGVRVAHGNITTMLTIDPTSPYYPMISECERLCSVATISFDAFIIEYCLSLFWGRTLVFSNENESKDPIALTGLLQRTGADYIGCTNSRMLQYLELPEFVTCLRSFKVILQGGEKFSDALLSKLKSINGTATIINGYGPTEISISCNESNLRNADVITVGRPHTNYTEWVLDKDGNELPVGVTGELCVGGDGVTQGYNNLPEKTAEKYISYGGMRAFKTGDYARWTEKGEVIILGRTDNQVKLRGLRIELGEVETAISRIEGIKNVLVKICKIQGRDHLSAYYAADRHIDADEIKKAISTTLTAYMVPSAYLQMDALPTTPNGKIDFRNLPEPELSRSSSEYIAPHGKDETFFANAFAEILGLEKVSTEDSFFDLGGTSLIVMRLVIAAQKAGYSITYSDVFAHQSPKALAAFAGNGEKEDKDPDADIKDFDYNAIKGILKGNNLDNFLADRSSRELGDILLTGVTGFLGVHIFRELLDNYPESKIHCLLRSKHGIAAEERLENIFYYYFERNIAPEIGKRVFIHEADINEKLSVSEHIDTLINTAAIVKHFARGSEIEDVNVGGVRNCIEFCLEHKARLIQISTYSVGGMSVNGHPDIKTFTEQMLFEGQRIANQYVHSKLMGERLLLDAVANRGLDGKIMRVGNLSARSEDGEFQINVKTNSFMGRLKIYRMLGVLPYSAFQAPVEFSPIDETASAICKLAGTNNNCLVFHPYNSHTALLGDVLSQMKVIGKDIRLVEGNEFLRILNEAKANPAMQEKLSAMLAYESKPGDEYIQIIPADNSFTMQVLLRLGFNWSETAKDYVDQFLHQVDSLSFFDEE